MQIIKDQSAGGIRREIQLKMASQTYDLLVIGGGITGVGIALDASSRGLKTALVEMQDFGAGTSSRSTKLIHGGLRYLKQFEIGLVRETGRERSILHRLAPHLVIPEKMLLPVIKGGTYGKLGVSIGLWIYDFLAGVKGEERRKMLSKDKALKVEPLLRKDILKGAGFYTEYRTDDARLTLSVMRKAMEHGADCLNYCAAVDLLYGSDGKICGAEMQDELSGERFAVKAKEVVNAAGPWVDLLRKRDDSLKGKRLHHTKGVHIVVPHEKFPLEHSVYFDVEDGRMIFAIPRENITYIGTTDTNYQANLEHPDLSREDVDYLIAAANQMFPEVGLRFEDVESSWAGIRPLIHEDGKSPSQLSRKDEIFESPRGMITIAGGKLTGFRKMAERTTNLVVRRLNKQGGSFELRAKTDKIPLRGAYTGGRKAWKAQLKKWATQHGLREEDVQWAASYYGTDLEAVLKLIKADDVEQKGSQKALIFAALDYSLENEAVYRLGDFLIRRTGILYFQRPLIPEILDEVEKKMAEHLGWSEQVREGEREAFIGEYREVLPFEEVSF